MSIRSPRFICDKCGICCRHIGTIPLLSRLDRGDGVCVHLRHNVCAIYPDRPDVCRVDRMYDLVFSQRMSWLEYVQMQTDACQRLKRMEEGGKF